MQPPQEARIKLNETQMNAFTLCANNKSVSGRSEFSLNRSFGTLENKHVRIPAKRCANIKTEIEN